MLIVRTGRACLVALFLCVWGMGSFGSGENLAGAQEEILSFAVTANMDSNTASFVDLSTRKIVANIPVGRGPDGVDIRPDGQISYVVNWHDSTLSVIDNARQVVTQTVRVGKNPNSVCFRPDEKVAYVANGGSSDITVLDAKTHQLIGTIQLPTAAPSNIDFLPDSSLAYVSNFASGEIFIIDAQQHQLKATVNTGGGCSAGVKVNHAGSQVYVADPCLSRVYIIDPHTNAVTVVPISGGRGAWFVGFSSDDRFAYVTQTDFGRRISTGRISVIDTAQQSEIRTLDVGGLPVGITVVQFQTSEGLTDLGVIGDPSSSLVLLKLKDGDVLKELKTGETLKGAANTPS